MNDRRRLPDILTQFLDFPNVTESHIREIRRLESIVTRSPFEVVLDLKQCMQGLPATGERTGCPADDTPDRITELFGFVANHDGPTDWIIVAFSLLCATADDAWPVSKLRYEVEKIEVDYILDDPGTGDAAIERLDRVISWCEAHGAGATKH